jgi:hypothetical protein
MGLYCFFLPGFLFSPDLPARPSWPDQPEAQAVLPHCADCPRQPELLLSPIGGDSENARYSRGARTTGKAHARTN